MDEVGDIVVRISNEDFTDVTLAIGDTYGDDDEGYDEVVDMVAEIKVDKLAKTLLMWWLWWLVRWWGGDVGGGYGGNVQQNEQGSVCQQNMKRMSAGRWCVDVRLSQYILPLF